MKYYSFGRNVLCYCGHSEWKINFVKESSEGYCWRTRKIIDIGLGSQDVKSLILHEIAHIGTARFCNNKHNRSFWTKRFYLGRKFLKGTNLPFWEQDLYNLYYNFGIYSKAYI